MKHFAKLDLSLLAIVVRGVNRGEPSNSCGVPVIFSPLMIGDVEFKFSHNTLDCWVRSDLAQAEVGEDSMNDEESCRATLSAAKRFLMELELLGVNGGICPLQHAHGFHILLLVVDNDYFRAIRILHRMHPMSVDDARCHFVLCRASIDETELKYF